MGHFANVIGIGILAFAATNIDDLFILIAFFANPSFSSWQVALGQYLGMAALIAVSVLGSLVTLVVPPREIGFAGLLPLILGLRQLAGPSITGEIDARGKPPWRSSNVLAVAAVTVADGGDNIGTYTPFFATLDASEIAGVILLFLVLTGVWCLAAYHLVRHPTVGAPIRRYGRRILPYVLIALGITIFLRSGALAAL